MADSETSRVFGAVSEKAGPLPVWAWGALATVALFAVEWWRNRQSGVTGNPTGNPTSDAPPVQGSGTPPDKPQKPPRKPPHKPPHNPPHGGGAVPQNPQAPPPLSAEFETSLGGSNTEWV